MPAEPIPAHTAAPPSFRNLLDPRLHLAAIVDSCDDAIYSKTLDGTIISWNPAAARIFGYQAEEIIGKSILTLIPPDLHNEEDEIGAKLRAGQRIEHCESIRVRKNGERFPVSVSFSPIRDESGDIIAISKIARDISGRKAIDEDRFRLAAIVDSADDAIISKDLNGIIKTWNEGALRMFGYAGDEIIGQPILRLIPQHLHYEEDQILRKLRAGQRIEHYETIRQKKGGELFEVSVTISPIKDESGTVIGASKIARDISDRKRIESMLLQSEKIATTGRMAATIAHEINNPLESLINLIFLARQHSDPGGRASSFLATAEEELERVAHIARQTLGFYKDTGAPADIYLHDILENVLSVYNSRILAARVTIDARFNDMRKISVSKGEMLQVFSNIIANAIDAMQKGGVLSVSTRHVFSSSQESIRVLIQDTGRGIDPKHLPQVFEPFFTTKGDLGTGIGLWVARRLVEQRGGRIAIASATAAGSSGTSVTIDLPLAYTRHASS
jgi:PAS domain S-box-containing protein